MKTTTIALLTLLILASCSQSDNEKETKNEALQDLSGINYEFKTVGEETEDNIRLVTKIEVINNTNQSISQTLEGFQAEVQKNEEVIVEDLNFDGFADIRLMQYLPTDESIAYFYWIYDNTNKTFVRSQKLEEKVFSPVIDTDTEMLISQWRTRDGTWGSNFYQFTGVLDFTLVKEEIHTLVDGDVFRQTVKELKEGSVVTVKDSTYQMNAYLPF